jgi:hypothetical protein
LGIYPGRRFLVSPMTWVQINGSGFSKRIPTNRMSFSKSAWWLAEVFGKQRVEADG